MAMCVCVWCRGAGGGQIVRELHQDDKTSTCVNPTTTHSATDTSENIFDTVHDLKMRKWIFPKNDKWELRVV